MINLLHTINSIAAREQPQELSPQHIWRPELEDQIEQLQGLLQTTNEKQTTAVLTLIAALHLRNDSLHTSHSYAQQIEHDQTGAYWHGIMHRMEEDYWNAKYWFRRAGNHPVAAVIAKRAAQYMLGKNIPDLLKHMNQYGSEQDAQNLPVENHSSQNVITSFDPAFSRVLQSYTSGNWNSSSFTDLVEMYTGSTQATSATLFGESKQLLCTLLTDLQQIEITALFEFTLKQLQWNE